MNDKRAIVSQLRDAIAIEIASMTKAARDAAEAATHEEAKPENDKDTRGLEASYLARGQAERVRELTRADNALQFLPLRAWKSGEPIALGAIVETDGGATYFVAPAGGGMRAHVDDVEIQVVTPEAPLGRALIGKSEGDEIEIVARGAKRAIEIVRVR
jgi:hypothetical protein